MQTLTRLIKGDNIAVNLKMPRSLFIFVCDYFFILCTCATQHLQNPHKPLNKDANWEVLTLNGKERTNEGGEEKRKSGVGVEKDN